MYTLELIYIIINLKNMTHVKKTLLTLNLLLIAGFCLYGATSAQADDDLIVPSVPTNLTASAVSSSQINLNWTAATDNVGVTGYAIFRNGLEISNITTTTFSNLGLTASTTYAYTIKAFDAAGNRSADSNLVSATTLTTATDITVPTTPTNLTATVVSSSQINLTWTAATDNVGVTGYAIFRNGTALATSTNTNFNNTGLTPSTAYTYMIKAFDAASNRSSYSNSVSTTTLATSTDTTAPSIPTNLSANVISFSQINLSWIISTDNTHVIGYAIFRNGTEVANVKNTNYHDIGLTASTTYNYTVKAFDAVGNRSDNSNTVSAITLATPINTTDTVAPSSPTNLKAHVVSFKHINLKWEASTDNIKVRGYIIFRDGIQIATVKKPHFNNIGLTASTTYIYTIKAFDAAGNMSTNSDAISVTTLAKKTKKHDHDENRENNESKIINKTTKSCETAGKKSDK
jgi:chitodextrinase